MADKGYYIQGVQVMGKMFPLGTKIYTGNHGYDPNSLSDMRGIFYATGTKLKKGYKAPPVKMVDQYNLMCHIIGLEPLPNNGSWDIIRPMLSNAPISVV
ncbi:ectonucleotide pyrophosphatase/phosphodiesterase family member 6-like [Limulus polyphemus]|uniref:Ectonucleotide pyrophosphatase/phosphodiesterase family member 6-like n=1 Tax=Limulus polyphemus TaxID=6850 RepID=A0ABM1TEE8_LIMPO|nr:ectonucleotide pyrophosphatase/phosphodiesterase family member 6-like [Limulus polyphemus]